MGHTKISKLRSHMTGKDLYTYINSLTSMNPSEVRIVIDKKEIYPNLELLEGWRKDCVISIKARLRGGCQEDKKWQIKKEKLWRRKT